MKLVEYGGLIVQGKG